MRISDGSSDVCSSGLLRAAEAIVRQNGLSSAHATFVTPEQMPLFEEAGWLVRRDIQFHFANQGYASFDDFLGTLNSQKRKQLRKERLRAVEGLRIEELTGDAIGPEHWDALWLFYQDTVALKLLHPYLPPESFDLMCEHNPAPSEARLFGQELV